MFITCCVSVRSKTLLCHHTHRWRPWRQQQWILNCFSLIWSCYLNLTMRAALGRQHVSFPLKERITYRKSSVWIVVVSLNHLLDSQAEQLSSKLSQESLSCTVLVLKNELHVVLVCAWCVGRHLTINCSSQSFAQMSFGRGQWSPSI